MRRLIAIIFFSGFISAVNAQIDSPANRFPVDSGYFSSFDNIKIYYEVSGKGFPVLLVHGFINNSQSWKRTPLYRDLLNAGYKVIILDLRGNGRSDHPHTPGAYANDAEAKDIMGLLKYLRISKYNVAGYSRGAIIVGRLLALDKNVQAAVIGGMGHHFTNTAWEVPPAMYEALMGKYIESLEPMKQYVRRSGLDSVALACMQKEQPFTLPAELARVQQPVLVIRGDKDDTNGSADELAGMIPHAVRSTTPVVHNDAHHAKAFSESVIDFFKKN